MHQCSSKRSIVWSAVAKVQWGHIYMWKITYKHCVVRRRCRYPFCQSLKVSQYQSTHDRGNQLLKGLLAICSQSYTTSHILCARSATSMSKVYPLVTFVSKHTHSCKIYYKQISNRRNDLRNLCASAYQVTVSKWVTRWCTYLHPLGKLLYPNEQLERWHT